LPLEDDVSKTPAKETVTFNLSKPSDPAISPRKNALKKRPASHNGRSLRT
jgi:hypothetical protein